MIKIEKIPEGASGTFVRNDKRIPIFVGMLLNTIEANSVEVTGGDVMYSIDETKIAYFKPKQVAVTTSAVQKQPVSGKSPNIVIPDSVKNLG